MDVAEFLDRLERYPDEMTSGEGDLVALVHETAEGEEDADSWREEPVVEATADAAAGSLDLLIGREGGALPLVDLAARLREVAVGGATLEVSVLDVTAGGSGRQPVVAMALDSDIRRVAVVPAFDGWEAVFEAPDAG